MTDETKIDLFDLNSHYLILKRRNIDVKPENTIPTMKHSVTNVMVWISFFYYITWKLHIMEEWIEPCIEQEPPYSNQSFKTMQANSSLKKKKNQSIEVAESILWDWTQLKIYVHANMLSNLNWRSAITSSPKYQQTYSKLKALILLYANYWIFFLYIFKCFLVLDTLLSPIVAVFNMHFMIFHKIYL